MSSTTVAPTNETPVQTAPANGLLALLRAMGLSAVQVTDEVVALTTTVPKR